MILTINGEQRRVTAAGNSTLLNVLREELDLTGAKYGCGEGACGACTVLVEGKPVRSCITPAASLTGKQIITIEGLAKKDELHYVQQAFLEADPFQCAYCASGMIMSAVSLLKRNPSPPDSDIISAMNGNICRCGTYPNILKAIKLAVNLKKAENAKS